MAPCAFEENGSNYSGFIAYGSGGKQSCSCSVSHYGNEQQGALKCLKQDSPKLFQENVCNAEHCRSHMCQLVWGTSVSWLWIWANCFPLTLFKYFSPLLPCNKCPVPACSGASCAAVTGMQWLGMGWGSIPVPVQDSQGIGAWAWGVESTAPAPSRASHSWGCALQWEKVLCSRKWLWGGKCVLSAEMESLRTAWGRRLGREELWRDKAMLCPPWSQVTLTISLVPTPADSHHKALLLVHGEKKKQFWDYTPLSTGYYYMERIL